MKVTVSNMLLSLGNSVEWEDDAFKNSLFKKGFCGICQEFARMQISWCINKTVKSFKKYL
jgi:hypothetical protein